jgi:hypothetical protein
MTKLIKSIVFGKDSKINGLIAFGIVAMIALGCNCNKDFNLNTSSNSSSSDNPFSTSSSDDDGDMPDDALIKALVKETTADFAYSISEGNFSKMYEKASTDFRSSLTLDQVNTGFADFIKQKRTVLPILSKAVSTDPEFTSPPRLRTEQNLSVLVTEGKYATKPLPVTFEYEYVKRDGRWKLLIVKVYIR